MSDLLIVDGDEMLVVEEPTNRLTVVIEQGPAGPIGPPGEVSAAQLASGLAQRALIVGGNALVGDQSVEGDVTATGDVSADGDIHSHGRKIDFGHPAWNLDRLGTAPAAATINAALVALAAAAPGVGGTAVVPPGSYNWEGEVRVPDLVHLTIEGGAWCLRKKAVGASVAPHVRLLGSNGKLTVNGILETQVNSPRGVVKVGPDTITSRGGQMTAGGATPAALHNTDPTFVFTADMVGLFVEVKDAGPPGISGGHLDTKIDSYQGPNDVTLHAPALQTVTGATFRVGPASSTLGNQVDGRGVLRGARYITIVTQVTPLGGRDGSIDAGSLHFTTRQKPFRQSDADGKRPITIVGAGPGGGLLSTFVDVFYPADGSIDLGVAASSTVRDAEFSYRTGATISLADATLVTTGTGVFTTAGSVGKRVVIDDAGPGGIPLDTTIASVPVEGGNQFRTTAAASTAVGASNYRIGNGATITAGSKVISIPVGLAIDAVMVGMAFTGVGAGVPRVSGLVPPFQSFITAVDTVAKTVTVLDLPPTTVINANYRIQSDCGVELDNQPNGAGGNGSYQNTVRSLRVEQFGTMERRINEANANTIMDLQPRRISQLLHHAVESGEDLIQGGFANGCPDLEAMIRVDGASLGVYRGVQGEPGGASRAYIVDALETDGVRPNPSPHATVNAAIDVTSNLSLGSINNSNSLVVTDRDNWTARRVRVLDGLVLKLVAGPVTDDVFNRTVENGLMAADSTNKRVMVRFSGTWYYVPYVSGPSAATTDLKDLLVALGLLADGGATPLNLDGGALSVGGITASQKIVEAPPVAHGNVSGAVPCSLAASTVHTMTLTGDTVITVTNVPATGVVYFTLDVSNPSNFAVSLPAAFKWPGGAAGSWNGEALWTWMTRDGGTTWKMAGAASS